MAAGSRTLFAEIFETNTTTPSSTKGRCAALSSLRNECLIDRYYYHGKAFKYRYNVLLELIGKEFFLSTATIPDIIDNNFEQLEQLKKQFADKSIKELRHYLQNKWPHLVW